METQKRQEVPEFQEVRRHSHPQNLAFRRSMRWIAQRYSLPEELRLSNKETGTIILRIQEHDYYILTMDIRDSKIRFSCMHQNQATPLLEVGADKIVTMEEDFEFVQAAVLEAIETDDDF